MRPVTFVVLSLLTAVIPCMANAAGFPRFQEVVIDPNCGNICYAITLADVDGDQLQDIVAVTENRVLWYRQPAKNAALAEWKKRVILEDKTERDNVCIAPLDIDADGRVDFALGAGWTKIGTIQWLTRGKTESDPWTVHFIDQEAWTHRMHFADVLGRGRPQLVVSPLNRTAGNGVRLSAFEIPADPKTGRWTRTVIDGELNRMHNHWQFDLDGDGKMETITASEEGVHQIRREGDSFQKVRLHPGAAGEKPEQRGTGEIKTGTLRNGQRFLVGVEPMHGTRAVVYLPPASGSAEWTRTVLDENLRRGHAVWAADLDGDGADEVIIGHSEPGPGPVKGPGVFAFQRQGETDRWTRHVLDDGGMATEDIAAADLTGDGRIDVVAGGRNTHNIKLYVNRGP